MISMRPYKGELVTDEEYNRLSKLCECSFHHHSKYVACESNITPLNKKNIVINNMERQKEEEGFMVINRLTLISMLKKIDDYQEEHYLGQKRESDTLVLKMDILPKNKHGTQCRLNRHESDLVRFIEKRDTEFTLVEKEISEEEGNVWFKSLGYANQEEFINRNKFKGEEE